MFEPPSTDLDTVIHVIQTSLTPIFLLTAIAGLLGVFTNRLARIADQVDRFAEVDPQARNTLAQTRLLRLRRRSRLLDIAVILGALAGGSTCGTALALFLGTLRAKATAAILFALFGLAISFTIGSLAAFLGEMLLAGRGLREEASRHQERLG